MIRDQRVSLFGPRHSTSPPGQTWDLKSKGGPARGTPKAITLGDCTLHMSCRCALDTWAFSWPPYSTLGLHRTDYVFSVWGEHTTTCVTSGKRRYRAGGFSEPASVARQGHSVDEQDDNHNVAATACGTCHRMGITHALKSNTKQHFENSQLSRAPMESQPRTTASFFRKFSKQPAFQWRPRSQPEEAPTHNHIVLTRLSDRRAPASHHWPRGQPDRLPTRPHQFKLSLGKAHTSTR